jgi:hypothetical protein
VLAERIGFCYIGRADRFELTVPIAFDRLLLTAVPALRSGFKISARKWRPQPDS